MSRNMYENEFNDTIKLTDLAKEVIRLADENPYHNYVPPRDSVSCFYTRGENGGCILGQALLNLYPHLKPLLEEVDSEGSMSITTLLKYLGHDNSLSLWYFKDIQTTQDSRNYWLECVSRSGIEEAINESQ